MVAMGGIELDCTLLNGIGISRSAPTVTVKATVIRAGFGWIGLNLAGRNCARTAKTGANRQNRY